MFKTGGMVDTLKFSSLKHRVPSDLSVVLEIYTENPRNLGVKPFVGPNGKQIDENHDLIVWCAKGSVVGAQCKSVCFFHLNKYLCKDISFGSDLMFKKLDLYVSKRPAFRKMGDSITIDIWQDFLHKSLSLFLNVTVFKKQNIQRSYKHFSVHYLFVLHFN